MTFTSRDITNLLDSCGGDRPEGGSFFIHSLPDHLAIVRRLVAFPWGESHSSGALLII